MGYFPNGTSGEMWEAKNCATCVHRRGPDGLSGCAVWLAHLIHNYKECNNRESILHILIPMGADGLSNEKCAMYHDDASAPDPNQADLFAGQP